MINYVVHCAVLVGIRVNIQFWESDKNGIYKFQILRRIDRIGVADSPGVSAVRCTFAKGSQINRTARVELYNHGCAVHEAAKQIDLLLRFAGC